MSRIDSFEKNEQKGLQYLPAKREKEREREVRVWRGGRENKFVGFGMEWGRDGV